jgi:hypothetical protein
MHKADCQEQPMYTIRCTVYSVRPSRSDQPSYLSFACNGYTSTLATHSSCGLSSIVDRGHKAVDAGIHQARVYEIKVVLKTDLGISVRSYPLSEDPTLYVGRYHGWSGCRSWLVIHLTPELD